MLTLPGGMPGHEFLYQSAPGVMAWLDGWALSIGSGFYTAPEGSTTDVVQYTRDPFTADQSIEGGRRTLDWAIRSAPGRVVVAGQSMGTMVIAEEQRALAADPTERDILWVETDSPQRGLGRLFPVGFQFPIIPWTVSDTPESQYDTIVAFGEYDGWSDPPDRPWNLLATVNALLGAAMVHGAGAYASPETSELLGTETNSLGGTTTTYMVPTPYLPLTAAWRLILPGPVVDVVDSLLRPIIDSAYTRHDQPGDTRPILERGQLVTPQDIQPPRQSASVRSAQSRDQDPDLTPASPVLREAAGVNEGDDSGEASSDAADTRSAPRPAVVSDRLAASDAPAASAETEHTESNPPVRDVRRNATDADELPSGQLDRADNEPLTDLPRPGHDAGRADPPEAPAEPTGEAA